MEAEAARLYLKARESESEEDWALAYAWVEQDPAHGYAFAKVEAGWDLTGRLGITTATSFVPDVEDALAEPNVARPGRRLLLAAALAATIVLAVTLSVQKWLAAEHYETGVGQERTVDLADGSKVHLNTNSAVEVDLKPNARSVHLLRGEASFNVAHNPAAPFTVRAGNASFTALGTSFNVRMRNDMTELTVMTGRVAINHDSPGSKTVTAGNAAAVRGKIIGIAHLDPAEVGQRIAWQGHLLEFSGETLEQAVAEFNRYRTTPLVIGSPQIASLRVGGTFRTDTSDLFVRSLESSFGIRAIAGNDGILLMPPTGEEADESAEAPLPAHSLPAP